VGGGDWAAMMRILLQVHTRTAFASEPNFTALTIRQCTSHCLEPHAQWELKRMAKQLMPLMTQVQIVYACSVNFAVLQSYIFAHIGSFIPFAFYSSRSSGLHEELSWGVVRALGAHGRCCSRCQRRGSI
jgi:hypothetical protein